MSIQLGLLIIVTLVYFRSTTGKNSSASELFRVSNIPLIICLTTHLVNFDLVYHLCVFNRTLSIDDLNKTDYMDFWIVGLGIFLNIRIKYSFFERKVFSFSLLDNCQFFFRPCH